MERGRAFFNLATTIGLLFVVVWGVIAYLRAEVLRRQRRGLLPGQQQPPE